MAGLLRLQPCLPSATTLMNFSMTASEPSAITRGALLHVGGQKGWVEGAAASAGGVIMSRGDSDHLGYAAGKRLVSTKQPAAATFKPSSRRGRDFP